jgi:hypothetical protein
MPNTPVVSPGVGNAAVGAEDAFHVTNAGLEIERFVTTIEIEGPIATATLDVEALIARQLP